MSEKPEALRLADALRYRHGVESFEGDAAKELRRLYVDNERLREALMRLQYDFKGHIKRYPSEEEVEAALRREET